MISHDGWMDSCRPIGRSTMMVRPKLPSAAPSDVGRVVGSQNVAGSECKSGNVAGRCGRMLGGCDRELFVGAGNVVWLPVLEDKSRTAVDIAQRATVHCLHRL